MSRTSLGTVEIFRYNPESDLTPSYQVFRVPYRGQTVLDVLRFIYESMDSSLSFRWACNGRCCRSCIISVNGRPALACMEPATRNMKLEPHPDFRVLKDLIVDLNTPA